MQYLHHSRIQLFLKKTLLSFIFIFLFNLSFPTFSSATQLIENNEKPSLAVLCYHHIVQEVLPKSLDTIICLSEFEDQMKFLYEHGYYTASLKDIEEFLYDKKKLPEKTVLITFDDGYESNYTYAYPVLKKYDFKAVIFVMGSKMVKDCQSQDPNVFPKLSFEQIKEMYESGLVEFGNHTFDAHDLLDGIPSLLHMDQDLIIQDFEQINELFDEIGLPKPQSIAFPYGKYNDTSILAAEIKEYKLGFTVKKGFVYQDSPPMILNRIIVTPHMTPDKFKALLQDNSPALPEGFEESIILRPGSNTAYVLGKPLLLKSSPIIVNGITMAPLDFFVEQLKWDVVWDPILYQVATKVAFENKTWLCFTAYPVDRNVMVPVKPLAKAMGYEVKWHQEQKMVELRKP